jgi:hypothetical protein
VAALAGRGAADARELPLVGIAVAALTGLRHAGEPDPGGLPHLDPAVAWSARHAGVAAGERVARLAVIEGDLAPGVDPMARLAAVLRHEARDLALVRVLVAVGATSRREVEGY